MGWTWMGWDVDKMGFKFVDEWNPKVTHFVFDADDKAVAVEDLPAAYHCVLACGSHGASEEVFTSG